MPPRTSRSRKRKHPVCTSDEDEGVLPQGSVTVNSEMGSSRGVSGSTTPRRRLDRANTPRIVSKSSSSRRSRARPRVDETGAAAGWRERRSHSAPRVTVQEDGSGEDESDVGSARGMSRSLAVPASPCGRFYGSRSNRSASPSVGAGVTRREQVAEDDPVIADHDNEIQRGHGNAHRKDLTEDEELHLRNPSHRPRTVRSVTPIQASSTTMRVAAVQLSRRSQESQQLPQNNASLTVSPPHAVRVGPPSGFAPPRTPSQDPTDSGPRHGSSYTGTSSSTVTSNGTSYYAGAHSLRIKEQYITTNNLGPSKTLFDYLNPHVAHGAAHNSRDRRDAPACHKETRVAIREHVVGWIEHEPGEDEAREIMWLSGPAGAGKSAIAGSVAETCKEGGILAATFFFSSFSPSKDRSWSRGLIATLIHHMSQHRALEAFRRQLLLALEEFPDIFHKQLREQAEHLILEPFREIHKEGQGRVGWPKAVIVDGIDEVIARCDRDEDIRQQSEVDQVEVLEVLFALAQNPYFPFRIFVASRPERNITDFFNEPTIHPFTVPLFLDSKYKPDADIERFLWSKFAQIRRRFRLFDASWPGQEAVGHIVDMSSGQFIVPTTVIRWIESGMPKQQLDEVLKLQRNNTGSKNPFESLDALYRHILIRARNPDDDVNLAIKWINSINSSVNQDHLVSSETPAAFWRSFLEGEEGELDYRMAPISSLISVPPPNDTFSPITFYHKSLIDYLSNQTRCEDLYVGKEEVNSFVSARVVVVLKHMGPRVPLLAPGRLDDFLSSLQKFHLVELPYSPVLQGDSPLLQHLATFLNHLGGKELDTLASCDVAWWAKLLPQQLGNSVTLPRFLRGIYFGIHKASKCTDLPRREDLSARQAAHEEGKPGCHPACVHWRTGILAGARKLGWCTHRLEAIPLHKLQDVTHDQARRLLSGSAREACWVCAPMTHRSRYDRRNAEEDDEVLGISYDKQLAQYVQL